MSCCCPYLTQFCQFCYEPCSIFEIKTLNNDHMCATCYKLVNQAKIDPDYKKAHEHNEKYKWYINNELYSVRGNYLLNKYPGETVVLDEVDRTLLKIHFLYDLGINPTIFVDDLS